mmetsp:Transcript_5942/g.10291  ORF Transcript_5942/g.10291 Transcript_5942/m.10291 type:complete len:243 (+) Transcript_5942:189-917(+)|eukprot:CAMPEP_0198216438 /NCGR_PEP_ID=MMETSP1445-20131203/57458_1 /TAXON_ID=36898 /ORGANISM="Pyramimonas sp., Strain CCMP2087" /LENGTH=242 /DNA_ID=CAMNT_0043892673 /DNA_START=183 /DNA_END=911 /DNA_ORIENTATION=+
MCFKFGDFFCSVLNARLQQQIHEIPSVFDARCCLLSGPSRSGKTSLLFQVAYNIAAEGKRVLFICQRAKVELNPPILPEGVIATSDACERIDMRYLRDDEELRLYIASFHMLPELPHAIIVDDFAEFFPESRYRGDRRALEIAMVRTLAFLYDATDHASKRMEGTEECKLVISDQTSGGVPRSIYLYQRWLPLVLLLSVVPDGEGFCCAVYDTTALQDMHKSRVQYNLVGNRFMVEHVEWQD